MRHSNPKSARAAAAATLLLGLFASSVSGQQDSTTSIASSRPRSPESMALLSGPSGTDAPLFAQLEAQVSGAYDSTRGGWVAKNGIPSDACVAFGFEFARRGGGGVWQDRALATNEWTWSLFDSTGGGFFQRLADTRHFDASFHKPTDANAARLENQLDAWHATGDAKYRTRARQVADFMDRVLLDGRGGFIDGQVGSRDLVPYSNGMAIHAWLEWAVASADPVPRDFALRSLDRAWQEDWHAQLGMLHKDDFGVLQKAPQLEDQIEMGRAYVLGSHVGGRAADLDRAKAIAALLESNFLDAKTGTWRTQAVPQKDGKIHPAASVADENARAALFLAELASVSGDARWRDAARRSIQAYQKDFAKAGLDAGDWARAVQALAGADLPELPQWKEQTTQKSKQILRFK